VAWIQKKVCRDGPGRQEGRREAGFDKKENNDKEENDDREDADRHGMELSKL